MIKPKTKADKMLRDMLLQEARQSNHPTFFTFLVKHFWWMSDTRRCIILCISMLIVALIMMMFIAGMTLVVLFETYL